MQTSKFLLSFKNSNAVWKCVLQETGLHCQVWIWTSKCSNSAGLFPRWSGFTNRNNNNWIMNTASAAPTSDWIHLSVDLLRIFSSLRVSWRRQCSWWSERALIDLYCYSIFKCFIKGCCLFSSTAKRWCDARVKMSRDLILSSFTSC